MIKCYSVDNLEKDIKPRSIHVKNYKQMMEISYLDELCNEEIPTKILVAKEISPCLLVRFKREYKHVFPYLKNIHVYLHMESDTILCM